jgi:hypothetical protein
MQLLSDPVEWQGMQAKNPSCSRMHNLKVAIRIVIGVTIIIITSTSYDMHQLMKHGTAGGSSSEPATIHHQVVFNALGH